jgi:hypothetical protein
LNRAGAGVFQRATGVHVGQDHCLFRRKNLGHLGHELHAAERDHIGVGLRRLARQFQRIADEIGQILQFRLLVIMRQDDGILLAAQALDLGADVDTNERRVLGGHERHSLDEFAPI